MQPKPTNDNSIEPNGSTYPRKDETREHLKGPLAELDNLGEDIASVHVQAALDCLGRDLGGKEEH